MSLLHSHERPSRPDDPQGPRAYRLDMPWFMPRLLVGFASVIVGSALVIFLFAPAPEASTTTHKIVGGAQFACLRELDRERMFELAASGDPHAADQYRDNAIRGGACIVLQDGDVVIPESAGFFGPVKLRRQGEAQTFYVARGVVK